MIRDKRKIFGQMLVDVVKYLLTIIVIGNIFAERINFITSIAGIIAAVIIGLIAFYVIPKDKEE
ncbi:hypothetical protein JZK55_08630 [Dissulfurispira thermophila]|uniref:Uncharacterized protein n=2 Tax=root TaxID=1 RepID=A0A7G1H1F5_9BACT|nr:hypothetical protein [Dissulfurispira thermophila]BCB95941.1 hypothetical protein JZK55_08630 [Dissulfurispira thermophila]